MQLASRAHRRQEMRSIRSQLKYSLTIFGAIFVLQIRILGCPFLYLISNLQLNFVFQSYLYLKF